MKKEKGNGILRHGPPAKSGIAGIWLAAALTGLAGCGVGEGKEAYREVTQDFAVCALLQDQDSKAYENALLAVGEYARDPKEETFTRAYDTLSDTISQMEEVQNSVEPYERTEELDRALSDCGIDPEEYKIYMDMRSVDLAEYAEILGYQRQYLEDASAGDAEAVKDLLTVCVRELEIHGCIKEYLYYGMNYWFSDWEAKETAYVQEYLMKRLESIEEPGTGWAGSRKEAEERMTAALDVLEEIDRQLAEEVGDKQKLLYRLEQLGENQ